MTTTSTRYRASALAGCLTRVLKGIVALTCVIGLGLAPLPAVAQQVFVNLHNLAFIDGTGPYANLILFSNVLYGTTHKYGGGTAGGDGSVFKLNTDGSGFTNLHTFSGIAPESGNLNGAVVLSGGTLYGTATFGGGLDHGAVFAIGTNGLGLANLYSFSPNPNSTNLDGVYPIAGLLLVGNLFYGTANGGGANNSGTLFAVNTNGTGFTNLHNFSFATGNYPSKDLILGGGTLFGATGSGGNSGYGTLFRISTNGSAYSNFYNFTASSGPDKTNSDGAFPSCSLVLSGTNLYGTASEGGDLGGGTLFTVDTNGDGFTVLHAFDRTNGITGTNVGGAHPASGVTLVSNVLYGTTMVGGPSGNGTVFKINTDGSGFTTLYNFSATNGLGTNGIGGTNFDGAHPVGGVVFANGTLYGTASEGGTAGFGTVFSLSSAPTLAITLLGTNAIVTWPSNVTGYNLQSTTNLTPPSAWNAVSGQYSVTNPIVTRQKFFRLMHP
jgi:uncharacterized repeat protein (TIGR03803 family)